MEKTELTFKIVVELFEYGKNNRRYWDRPKLYKQMINKALPIVETFYLGYSYLFLFDNAISHSVYAENELCIRRMNKKSSGKQVWLRNK